jgi:hypothetical protein
MGKRDFRNECYLCAHKREVPGNAHIQCVKPDADIRGNQHGIDKGWFYYPFLFDPAWKENMCKNYEDNDLSKSVVNQPVSVAGKSV